MEAETAIIAGSPGDVEVPAVVDAVGAEVVPLVSTNSLSLLPPPVEVGSRSSVVKRLRSSRVRVVPMIGDGQGRPRKMAAIPLSFELRTLTAWRRQTSKPVPLNFQTALVTADTASFVADEDSPMMLLLLC